MQVSKCLVVALSCLFVSSCAHVSMPQYPEITGVIVDSAGPIANTALRLLEDDYEADMAECDGNYRTTTTSEIGEFAFEQKNVSAFLSNFNVDS